MSFYKVLPPEVCAIGKGESMNEMIVILFLLIIFKLIGEKKD